MSKEKLTIDDLAELGQEDQKGEEQNLPLDNKEEKAPEIETNKDKDGLALFLESRDLDANALTIGDEVKKFYELEAETQKTILESLATNSGPELSQEEEDILSVIRESKMTPQDYINNVIEEKIKEVKPSDISLEQASDKDIYASFMKKSNPDISDEEIESKFELLEDSNKLESKINAIKDLLEEEKLEKIALEKKKLEKQLNADIESDRHLIVDSISEIEEVGGWKLDEDMINDTLEDLMETVDLNDGGKISRFQADIMSDPKKMFKANWYMKYGDLYFDRLDKFSKKNFIDGYEKGRKENGAPEIVGDKEPFFKKPGEDKNSKKRIKTTDDLID